MAQIRIVIVITVSKTAADYARPMLTAIAVAAVLLPAAALALVALMDVGDPR
jgi:hypothetical protein